MNKRIRSALSAWPFLILGVAASTAIVCAGVSIRCAPTYEESIYVFAPTYSFDVAPFVKDGLLLTNGIREITVKHAAPDSDEAIRTFGSYYAITDFYVLPKSWVERIAPIALTFGEEEIHKALPNSSGCDFYIENGKNIGIKVYDAASEQGASLDIISYAAKGKENEDYYLIFRNESLHCAPLNGGISSNAFALANYLLGK